MVRRAGRRSTDPDDTVEYYTQEDVNEMVAMAVAEEGNANRFAKRLGVSRQFIRHIKMEGRSPGQKVLDYLGLERVVRYIPKEK